MKAAESSPAGYTLHCGSTPLLVSVPHVGTEIPVELHSAYLPRAIEVEDTDWLLDRLYDFVRGMGAGLIVPRVSRYVVDLNRPSENTPMYAGANNTELCPTRCFTGEPLYREGRAPDDAEIAHRVERHWRPYHTAVDGELGRLQALHGHAVLFDAHSIKSELPWLFDGVLPALNLGTVKGNSCAPSLRSALVAVLEGQTGHSIAVDGRFKGGHITRWHGRQAEGRHAVQLEMCWRCYMREESPYVLDPARVATIEPTLRALVQSMIDWRPDGR
jgi:N-formylglutamate deformylase